MPHVQFLLMRSKEDLKNLHLVIREGIKKQSQQLLLQTQEMLRMEQQQRLFDQKRLKKPIDPMQSRRSCYTHLSCDTPGSIPVLPPQRRRQLMERIRTIQGANSPTKKKRKARTSSSRKRGRGNNSPTEPPAEPFSPLKKREVTCSRCGRKGHNRTSCGKVKHCSMCGKPGHNSRTCKEY